MMQEKQGDFMGFKKLATEGVVFFIK